MGHGGALHLGAQGVVVPLQPLFFPLGADEQVPGGDAAQVDAWSRPAQQRRQPGVGDEIAAEGEKIPLGVLAHVPVGQLPGRHHIQMAQGGGHRPRDARVEHRLRAVFRDHLLGTLGGAHLAHAANGCDDSVAVEPADIPPKAGFFHRPGLFHGGKDVFQLHLHGGDDGDHRASPASKKSRHTCTNRAAA